MSRRSIDQQGRTDLRGRWCTAGEATPRGVRRRTPFPIHRHHQRPAPSDADL